MKNDVDTRREEGESEPFQRTVAVAVAVHDQARFLAEAIDSILAQTYRPAQIIVVDDGSHDDPAQVVARYDGSVPPITFVRQENSGLSAARNAGLARAATDYIVFLDADDVLLPSALELGTQCLAADPDAGFAYGAYRLVDEHLQVTSGPHFRPLRQDGRLALLHENIIGMHGAVIYDRQRLADAGGFDEELCRCEDYDAFFRMAQDHAVACHPGVVADYRMHSENMSMDPVEMLAWALKIHARYRPPDHDRAGQKAWRAGQAFLKACYANDSWKIRPGRDDATMRRQRKQMMAIAPRQALLAAAWQAARRVLPERTAQQIKRLLGRVRSPALGNVDMGDLARVRPISSQFGFDRGTPVDRHYIESFLQRNRRVITGHVLEVGDADYSRRFGSEIFRQDVLNHKPGHPETTIIGDMAQAGILPDASFDCIIVTQTLHLIYDMEAAVQHLHNALKPGGTLLLTVPGISPIDTSEFFDIWYWSLTTRSLHRLLEGHFGAGKIAVEAHGNVYAATSFLHGLAFEEVRQELLDKPDPAFPVIITARATRAA